MQCATSNQAIDSVLEDFSQEISERRSPDEHAMGSGKNDINVSDVQRIQLTIKLLGCRSNQTIGIADENFEKAQFFVDLIGLLQRVGDLVAEN
jgi:hypothetical protein